MLWQEWRSLASFAATSVWVWHEKKSSVDMHRLRDTNVDVSEQSTEES